MSLAITAMGMVSSVGLDVATTCASIRAGIQRPRDIDYFTVLDAEEQEPKPLTGRPIHGYTDGFTSVGLWLRLAIGSAQDMADRGGLPPAEDAAFWSRTGLIAVTPSLATSRFADDRGISEQRIREGFLNPLIASLRWPVQPAMTRVLPIGHAGAIDAIRRSAAAVSNGTLDRVIVIAADSYLDPWSLDWLNQSDRLKSDDNPFGLVPGEAGACFLVESDQARSARTAPVLGYAEGASVAAAEQPRPPDAPRLGEGLAQAISGCIAAAKLAPFSGLMITDLNGEPSRAQDWGSARVRVGQDIAEEAALMLPCASLGETGAASGAVAVCLALCALQRGYAGGRHVLIASNSEDGYAASVCVAGA